MFDYVEDMQRNIDTMPEGELRDLFKQFRLDVLEIWGRENEMTEASAERVFLTYFTLQELAESVEWAEREAAD